MINQAELELLRQALTTLAAGFEELPEFATELDEDAVAKVLHRVAVRMQGNYPYHHPNYAGQMLKPPHAVARIAYAMSLWLNPNNHALDGGRASSAMEKECVAELGRMFGWSESLGHLTGGGTMANLEALWVASLLRPGQRIVASEQAHYTHRRICEVLGAPFSTVPVDDSGRMDMAALELQLKSGDVGTIIATTGTTGLGAVDPLAAIMELSRSYDVRVHADAAYGGYFVLSTELGGDTRAAYDALRETDSIVVDPHKHGLQPYGCGCILFRDPTVGRFYAHESPYTYFTSTSLHLGEISLECSRAGAAAVALWATHQLYPLEPGGQLGRWLDDGMAAARELHWRLEDGHLYQPMVAPELDIVVYAAKARTSRASSRKARDIFEAAARRDLHLALIELPTSMLPSHGGRIQRDSQTITCLRSALMKPEHKDWVERITTILEECA
jgi:glutamate/tyrosine decarboxylase-like PLP-dependent enzyme